MNIVYKKIGEVKPYERNPRRNDEAVAQVAESIRRFGFKVPIVIDKDGVIVAGHTRVKAAKKLGLKEVPCVVAEDLTPEQVKAFRLADNKVSELAEWDFDMLHTELSGLTGFNMEDFGFYAPQEDTTFDDLFNPPQSPAPAKKEEPKPEAPEVPEAEEDEPEEAEHKYQPNNYQVIVTVDTEEEMEALLEMLKENGYQARRW